MIFTLKFCTEVVRTRGNAVIAMYGLMYVKCYINYQYVLLNIRIVAWRGLRSLPCYIYNSPSPWKILATPLCIIVTRHTHSPWTYVWRSWLIDLVNADIHSVFMLECPSAWLYKSALWRTLMLLPNALFNVITSTF